MFKGKTLIATAITLLLASTAYAADEGSGEIHFKGKSLKHHVKLVRTTLINKLNSVKFLPTILIRHTTVMRLPLIFI